MLLLDRCRHEGADFPLGTDAIDDPSMVSMTMVVQNPVWRDEKSGKDFRAR